MESPLCQIKLAKNINIEKTFFYGCHLVNTSVPVRRIHLKKNCPNQLYFIVKLLRSFSGGLL